MRFFHKNTLQVNFFLLYCYGGISMLAFYKNLEQEEGVIFP